MSADQTKLGKNADTASKLLKGTGRRAPVEGLAQGVRKDFIRKVNEKTVGAAFRGLATREQTLEKILIDAARGALGTVEKVFEDATRTAVREKGLDLQYRESLLQRSRETKRSRGRRARKGEYRIVGQVLHPSTGQPVPGMLVSAMEKDISKHDYLGVDISDASGNFEIVFTARQFKESGEKEPEVFLAAGTDRENAVVLTDSPLRPRPDITETVDIALPAQMAPGVERIVQRRRLVDRKRLATADQAILLNDMSQTAATEVGKALAQGLGRIIGFLENKTARERRP